MGSNTKKSRYDLTKDIPGLKVLNEDEKFLDSILEEDSDEDETILDNVLEGNSNDSQPTSADADQTSTVLEETEATESELELSSLGPSWDNIQGPKDTWGGVDYEFERRTRADASEDDPVTLLNKGEDNVKAILQGKFKGLDIQTTGGWWGNSVKAVYRDQEIEIDLKPGRRGVNKALEAFGKLSALNDAAITDKKWRLTHNIDAQDNNENINALLTEMGVGFTMDDYTGITTWEITPKDGGENVKFTSPTELEEYIRDTITPEDLVVYQQNLTDRQQEANNTKEETKKILKTDEDFAKKAKEVYDRSGSFLSTFELTLNEKGGDLFTKEQIDEILKSRKNTPAKIEPRIRKHVDITSHLVPDTKEEMMDYYYNIAKILPNLTEEQKEWLDATANKLYDDGVKDTLDESIKREGNTIIEHAVHDAGMTGLLEAANTEAGISLDNGKKVIKTQITSLEEKAKKTFDGVPLEIEKVIQSVNENVGFEMKEIDGNPTVIWTTNGSKEGNDWLNSDEGKGMQNRMSAILKKVSNTKSEIEQGEKDLLVQISEWDKKSKITGEWDEILGKEHHAGEILVKDFSDAVSTMFVSIPALLGSDSAISKMKELNQKNKYYETQGELGSASGSSVFWGLRTVTQQMPNIILAIATQGVGTSLAAGGAAARQTAIGLAKKESQRILAREAAKQAAKDVNKKIGRVIASEFGIISAGGVWGQGKIDLEYAKQAQGQLDYLEKVYKAGGIDGGDYIKNKVQLLKTISYGELTHAERAMHAVGAGLIESGTMLAMGGVTRYQQAWSRLKSPINIPKHKITTTGQSVFMRNAGIWGRELKGKGIEIGKNVLGEIAEEETIYVASELWENAVLQGAHGPVSFEEFATVGVTAILTSGAMNGSSSAYAGVVNAAATVEHIKGVSKLKVEYDKIMELVGSAKTDGQKVLFVKQATAIMSQLTDSNNALEIDALMMGDKNIYELFTLNTQMNDLLARAEATLEMRPELIKLKLNRYKKQLTDIGKKSEADAVQAEYDAIIEEQKKLKEGVEYTGKSTEDLFGNIGIEMEKKLKNDSSTPAGKKYKNAKGHRAKLAVIFENIKKDINQEYTDLAKKRKYVVEIVSNLVDVEVKDKTIKNSKKAKDERAEELYNEFGKAILNQVTESSTTFTKENVSIESLQKQDEEFEVIEVNTVEDLEAAIREDETMLETEKEKTLTDLKNTNVSGAIIGGKWLVIKNTDAFNMMKNGLVSAGTVVSHEYGHYLDNKAFKDVTEFNDYAQKLHGYGSKNYTTQHSLALDRINNIPKYGYNPELEFNDQSNVYKNEYTRAFMDQMAKTVDDGQVSELNTRAEKKFKRKGVQNGDFVIKTELDAFMYAVDFRESFMQGKVSNRAQAKIAANKLSNMGTESGLTVQQSADLYTKTDKELGIEQFNEKDVKGRQDHMKKMSPEQKETAGFMIGDAWTNVVKSRLRKTYSHLSGYNKNEQDIIIDITVGDVVGHRGIRQLVREYEGDVPMSAYINTFLDKKILGVVQYYRLGEDAGFDSGQAADMVDLIAPEPTGTENYVARIFTDLINSKLFNTDVIANIKSKVISEVRVLKSRLNEKVSKNTTVKPWVREFLKGVSSQADIDVSESMGGMANNKLKNFLIKHKKAILENMTTTYLSKSMPFTIQKRIDGKWTTKWNSKSKVDRAKTKTNNTGSTSGFQFIRRIPNIAEVITDQQFVDNFIQDGKILDKRKLGLAKAIAGEIALEILATDESALLALDKNQDAEILIEQIVADVDRGKVKFSEEPNPEALRGELFDFMKALIEAKTEEEYNQAIELEDDFIVKLAKEIGLLEMFSEGEKNFKGPLTKYMQEDAKGEIHGILKGHFETYQKTASYSKTKSFTPASLEQQYAFGLALYTSMPPSLAKQLGAAFFGFTSRYLDPAKQKVDKIRSAPGKTVYLFDKNDNPIRGEYYNEYVKFINYTNKADDIAENESGIGLDFNIKDVRIINSGMGVMAKVEDILMKPFETKEAKTKAIQDELGEEIELANIANHKALAFVTKLTANLMSNKPELLVGALRFNEASTNNTKAQRGLTTLHLINITRHSQAPYILEVKGEKTLYSKKPKEGYVLNEGHPAYGDAVKFAKAVLAVKESKLKEKGKIEDEFKGYDWEKKLKNNTSNKGASKKYAEAKSEEAKLAVVREEYAKLLEKAIFDELKFKGEHIDPAANVMLKLVKSVVETVSVILNNGALKDGQMKLMGIEVDNILRTYSQSSGAHLYSAIQDKVGGTTSKLSTLRGLLMSKTQQDAFITLEGESNADYMKRNFIEDTAITEAIERLRSKGVIRDKNRVAALTRFSEESDIKKARVFDFDDTLAQTKSNVLYTLPDGSKGSINATQFAAESTALEDQGAKFDFSEFNKVIDGKKGPLFGLAKLMNDSPGKRDMFVLTARPQAAAKAIHTFLKGLGLEIPMKNIIGLSDGNPQAKGDWIMSKAAEGFNDFYFADDAMKNVKAVKEVLDLLDVKGQVQQAKIQFSEEASLEFNRMIFRDKGMRPEHKYSDIVARGMGAKFQGTTAERIMSMFGYIMPNSAEDFKGLTSYIFSGEGKQGDIDQKWWKDTFFVPYSTGIDALNSAKQHAVKNYKKLLNKNKGIKKVLKSKIPGTEFTGDHAVRVYLWVKQGVDIPGLSKRDAKMLHNYVVKNKELQQFANELSLIAEQDTYFSEPTQYWDGSTILADVSGLMNASGRHNYIAKFIENRAAVFGEWQGGRLISPNMNKVEALYGIGVRENLENVLWRMEQGTNQKAGAAQDNQAKSWLDWINNSVGAIMFINVKTAALQMLSVLNFTNMVDNNPLQQLKAISNIKQWSKDVSYLLFSDKLVERRRGLKQDVLQAELANTAAKSNGSVQAMIAKLIQFGFTPTQAVDALAIATGGASFYRNRTNTYIKEGMSVKDAEAKAFIDFSLITEETQQSSDPAFISAMQSGSLGRIVLAFANTPMQYNRLIKKAILDLKNKRGDAKSHVATIMYYGFLQNLIFSALQNMLGMFISGDDEEYTNLDEYEIAEKREEANRGRALSTINSMSDTLLRGAGLYGAVVSSMKNTIMEYYKQKEKGWMGDNGKVIMKILSISPPISSKLQKVYSALDSKSKWNKDLIEERGWELTDSEGNYNLAPNYDIYGKLITASTNVPVDRVIKLVNQVAIAFDNNNTTAQRIFGGLGWTPWTIGIDNDYEKGLKVEIKEKKKVQNKIDADAKKAEDKIAVAKRLEELKASKSLTESEAKEYHTLVMKKTKTKEQYDELKGYGLTSKQIKSLGKEADRVNKIIELRQSGVKYVSLKKQITDRLDELSTKKSLTNDELKEYTEAEAKKSTKPQQVKELKGFGLTSKQIRKLKYEEDRVKKLIALRLRKLNKKP